MKKLFSLLLLVIALAFFAGCDVAVEGITITSEGDVRTINVNGSLQLTAKVFPEDANQEVTWSSSDNGIATVTDAGLVTGVAIGNVQIVAKSKEDESITQSFALIVEVGKEAEAESVVIDEPTTKTLKAGETLTLVASVLPNDASQQLTWTSSDESVATVNRGVVTGLKEGIVTIYASAKNNDNVKASIELTIEKGEGVVTGNWSEMNYSTHEEYISCEAETPLKVKGVVVYVYPNDGLNANYVIQNGKDGYYVYNQDITKYPVEEGKVYEVGGFKKNYQGLNEIVNVEYLKELDEVITYTPNKLENVDTSSLEAMDPYQGSIVCGEAVLKSVSVNDSKAYTFYTTVGEYDLQFRVDPKYCSSEDFTIINTMLKNAVPGTKFDFSGVMTAYGYGGAKPQIQVIKASDLALGEVSTEQLLQAALNKITITSSIAYGVDSIELPKKVEGFDDAITSWASNSDAINVITGEVTHGEENINVILTFSINLDGEIASKDFLVIVMALDDKTYEVVASLDLEDAAEPNQWGNSETKSGYAEGVVELGTPKHNWLLRNALIAAATNDIYDGRLSIRAKAGNSASETGRIEIQEDGEYNVVEFDTAVYGNDAEGIQIKVEYSTDSGKTWIASEIVISVSSHELETYRISLPEGVKRVALVIVENSGNRVNIDNIKLMK